MLLGTNSLFLKLLTKVKEFRFYIVFAVWIVLPGNLIVLLDNSILELESQHFATSNEMTQTMVINRW